MFVPNGVVYHQGDLYVALIDQVFRYNDIDLEKVTEPIPTADADEIVLAHTYLHNSTWHGWRYLVAKNDSLYIAIGAPCNVPGDGDANCMADPDKMGAIHTLGPLHTDTGRRTNSSEITSGLVAKGVRNTVGMTFHPVTGDLWFTDNGRDDMKRPFGHLNYPPDELNHLSLPHSDFGFFNCYGYDLNDPQFFNGSCREAGYVGAAQELDAHAAALGM